MIGSGEPIINIFRDPTLGDEIEMQVVKIMHINETTVRQSN